MTTAEEEAEPSRAAGGCVLAVAAGVPLAVVFAASRDAGVLTVWGVVVASCGWQWRRRVSDSSATPPPRSTPPLGDVYADESTEVERVVWGPEGVVCTLHPKRQPAPPAPRRSP
ncbi:hypothetical protein GCM10009731_09380 [Streptomyces globosus]